MQTRSGAVAGGRPRAQIGAIRLLGLMLLSMAVFDGCTIRQKPPEPVGATAAGDLVKDRPAASRPHSVVVTGERHAGQLERLMLADLIDVLVQLRTPLSTTVQVQASADSDPLGQTAVALLVDRGYGIQRVDADQGANLLHWHRVVEARPDTAEQVTLRLRIGELRLARSYQATAGALQPTGPVELAGTRQPVVLDDRRFGAAIAANPTISLVHYTGGDPQKTRVPVISLITPDVVAGATRAATGAEPATRALNSARMEVQNLFFGETSTFGALRQDYQRIDRQVIVFGDDSLRLGPTGKQQVRQLVERYEQDSDLFSLVGCSNGPTQLDIGNQGLALGRSERVVEELVALGIGRDQILDEGCWAPVSAGDRFPGRGVVIELLRKGR